MDENESEEELVALQMRFKQALIARSKNDIDAAGELLRGILAVEPRLPEPHLELSNLLFTVGQHDDALVHAEEAVKLLEAGGQWTDDLPENVLMSLAYSTLGEILLHIANQDSTVFGPEEEWKKLMSRSRTVMKKAQALDPDNDHSDDWSDENE
jgi:hypothetical protein